MRTRDRILEQALILFNELGLGRASLNQVAIELNISSGNLHYHFKTRGLLIARLLSRLENDLSPLVAHPPASFSGIDDFWLYLHMLLEVCLRYRFVFRDIDQIIAEHDNAMPRLIGLRSSIQKAMFESCVVMRERQIVTIEESELPELAQHLAFVIVCWPTFDLLSDASKISSSGPETAAYQALSLLAPHLDTPQRGYLNYLRGKYLARSAGKPG